MCSTEHDTYASRIRGWTVLPPETLYSYYTSTSNKIWLLSGRPSQHASPPNWFTIFCLSVFTLGVRRLLAITGSVLQLHTKIFINSNNWCMSVHGSNAPLLYFTPYIACRNMAGERCFTSCVIKSLAPHFNHVHFRTRVSSVNVDALHSAPGWSSL